jgi:hypothetical protein
MRLIIHRKRGIPLSWATSANFLVRILRTQSCQCDRCGDWTEELVARQFVTQVRSVKVTKRLFYQEVTGLTRPN